MPIRCLCILVWLVVTAWSQCAFAQAPEEINQRLNGMNAILDTIEASLDREGLSNEELVEHRREAYDVAADAQTIVTALQPSLADLDARREALKPAAPAEGEAVPNAPQSQELASDQAKIDEEYAAVDELSKRATAVVTRANQLAAKAAAVERDRFTRRIFERDDTIAGPDLWQSVLVDLPQAVHGVEQVFSDVGTRLASRGGIGFIPPVLFLLAIALVMVPRLRHGMVSVIAARFGQDRPTEFGKAVVASLVAVFVTFAPIAGLLLARWVAGLLDIASPNLLGVGDQAAIAVLVVSISIGLSRAFLAPKRPNWRLVDVGDAEAQKLSYMISTAATTLATGVFLSGVAHVARVPQSIIIFVGSFIALFFAWALILALRPYRAMLEPTTDAGTVEHFKYQGILRFCSMAGMLAAVVIVVGTLLGYVPLAWFLCKQVVWISVIFAIYALIANLLDTAGAVVPDTGHPAGNALARLTGMRQGAIAQVGMIVFGILKLLLAGLALILIAAPWGFQSQGAFEQIRSLLSGFQIGGLNISPSTIAAAFLLFGIGMFFSRSFQSWLSDRFLPTTSIDPGLKNSITTTAGYLGFIISVVIAFAFVGIDLSQLGLVAGALSVGVGFGLQSIVNNFVSGLILLAERPIKAGDWIIVGSEEGTVRKINVRATEIETFDRATVVIPNSDLISGTVRNWVLSGSMGRISLVVGVGYNSDADQVRDILIACAESHELVLAYPAPAAFFLDFGDNALIFRLDGYLADISNGFRVRSDLRFDLLRRFREAGIEIPFPQRDLHIRSSDELTELMTREKASSD